MSERICLHESGASEANGQMEMDILQLYQKHSLVLIAVSVIRYVISFLEDL